MRARGRLKPRARGAGQAGRKRSQVRVHRCGFTGAGSHERLAADILARKINL